MEASGELIRARSHVRGRVENGRAGKICHYLKKNELQKRNFVQTFKDFDLMTM